MSFMPRMTSRIEGLRPCRPLQWRSFGPIVADLWRAEGEEGGRGYYVSPDPRIVIFFSDLAGAVRVAETPDGFSAESRPLGRIIFVPAGRPLWSRVVKSRKFQHLDLHFEAAALHRLLTARIGAAAAEEALKRPVMLARSAKIEALARLLAEEIAKPAEHDLYAEGLAQSLAAAVLSLGAEEGAADSGGLSKARLRRLTAHMRENLHRRPPIAELAEVAGLSESWFSQCFKQATGETPAQWRMRLRVERAQEMIADPARGLAEIAAALGFADQAHLTRAFRAQMGGTPAAWRRLAHGAEASPQDSTKAEEKIKT